MIEEKLNTYFENSTSVGKDVTFANAKFESIHRWFPYLEGFSEAFIDDIVKHIPRKITSIYEPFAGSGTLPIYAMVNGYDIYYSEVNPFLKKLIDVKLKVISLSKEERSSLISKLKKATTDLNGKTKTLKISERLQGTYNDTFPGLKYFPENNFQNVLKIRSYLDKLSDELVVATIEMACCEALLHSSYLKRSGDIRYRKGKELEQITDFISRTEINLNNIIEDLSKFPLLDISSNCYYTPNAKHFDNNIKNKIDLIITSPPYLNGTNYIRNAKLELWFLGYLKTKSDLSHYRKLVVTAGINDVSSEKKVINLPSIKKLLDDPSIWYDKRIPKMINDYFFDMQEVFINSAKYLKKKGLIFVDIGDSIYGGVHIPTDLLLIDLLSLNGYKFIKNIMLRERRSKSGEIVKQTLILAEKL